MLFRRQPVGEEMSDIDVLWSTFVELEDKTPVPRDTLGKRAGMLAMGAAVAWAGAHFGMVAMQPPERPAIFGTIPFVDGKRIDCSEVVAGYIPEDESDLVNLGGAPAIFETSDLGHGLLRYYKSLDSVTVYACDHYLKQATCVEPDALFQVDTSLMPRPDKSSRSFQVVATITMIVEEADKDDKELCSEDV